MKFHVESRKGMKTSKRVEVLTLIAETDEEERALYEVAIEFGGESWKKSEDEA